MARLTFRSEIPLKASNKFQESNEWIQLKQQSLDSTEKVVSTINSLGENLDNHL